MIFPWCCKKKKKRKHDMQIFYFFYSNDRIKRVNKKLCTTYGSLLVWFSFCITPLLCYSVILLTRSPKKKSHLPYHLLHHVPRWYKNNTLIFVGEILFFFWSNLGLVRRVNENLFLMLLYMLPPPSIPKSSNEKADLNFPGKRKMKNDGLFIAYFIFKIHSF